jgi:hypothetical protein
LGNCLAWPAYVNLKSQARIEGTGTEPNALKARGWKPFKLSTSMGRAINSAEATARFPRECPRPFLVRWMLRLGSPNEGDVVEPAVQPAELAVSGMERAVHLPG